jgi:TonB-dependent receptor
MHNALRLPIVRAILMVVFLCAVGAAYAQATVKFNLPSEPLADSLRSVASQTNSNILFDKSLVYGLKVKALNAELNAEQAVARLLEGTGLTYRKTDDKTVVIVRVSDSSDPAPSGPNPAPASVVPNQAPDQRSNLDQAARSAVSPAQSSQGTPPPGSPDQTGNSQTSDDQKVAMIVVTAQRQAMRREQEIKMDSMGVVDSVSAEEAGQFPDQNIADALQRVPGVSVNRGGGESNQISIRGFGPQFIATTVNGRVMATDFGSDAYSFGSFSPSMAFNFDVLPSELISVAKVSKTATADGPDGGIGGTVDIVTARPFDTVGFHAVGTLAGVNDTLSGGPSGGVRPKAYMMGSWTDPDKTFGVLASLSYYERNSTQVSASTGGWLENQSVPNNNPPLTNVTLPQKIEIDPSSYHRVRQGASLALDWAPTDTVMVKADALFSNYLTRSRTYALSNFNSTSAITNVTYNQNNTALGFTCGTDPTAPASGCYDMTNDYVAEGTYSSEYDLLGGVNVAWNVTSSSKLDFDVAYSEAWDHPGTSPDNYYLVDGARRTGDFPVWTNNGTDAMGTYSATTLGDMTDLNALRVHYENVGSGNVTNEIPQVQLHLEQQIDAGALSRLDVGGKWERYLVTNQGYDNNYGVPGSTSAPDCAYCGYLASVPGSMIGAFAYNVPDAGILSQYLPNAPHQWVGFNPYLNLAALSNPATLSQLPAATQASLLQYYNNYFLPTYDPATYNQIVETNKSAYVKAFLQGQIFDQPWALDLGLRYVHTNTVSVANFQQLLGLNVGPNGCNNCGQYGPLQPQSASGEYSYVLPSANFKVNVSDNLIYRLSVSKTLTRPDLVYLDLNTSYNTRPQFYAITRGNPDLKPYLSKNVDSGLEWYIDRDSYLAAEGFYKSVSNFVTSITTPIPLLGQTFSLTEPTNLNSATVKGAEFAANYRFSFLPAPFSGLGVAFNYTIVSSSATINPGLIRTSTFALPGMGDSMNVSGYYDRGPWQTRLAYNWRAAYLDSISAGGGGLPETTAAYGQLDFSGAYKVNDHVSVFASATNLTNAVIFRYMIYPNQPDYFEADGRTYMLGVRAAF